MEVQRLINLMKLWGYKKECINCLHTFISMYHNVQSTVGNGGIGGGSTMRQMDVT